MSSEAKRNHLLLAAETGLSVEDIDNLATRGELAREYQRFIDANGCYRMRSSTEQRRLRTPQQRLIDIQGKRWPAEPKSGRQLLMEILAKRWPKDQDAR